VLTSFDVEAPLSVGNGAFAFTADPTGLQSFPERYAETIPLGTFSDQGWHESPNPEGYSIDRFGFGRFESHGRRVGYADVSGEPTAETEWLRRNPHRLHLGVLGFSLRLADGTPATPEDLADVHQELVLWEGRLSSHFRVGGQPVEVETLCHPELDLIAVRVVSPLVGTGRLALRLRFPYGTGETTGADWTHPEAHATRRTRPAPAAARFERRLDGDRYTVDLAWSGEASLEQRDAHDYTLSPEAPGAAFEVAVAFGHEGPVSPLPSWDATRRASARHWERFWTRGGALDLSGSRDPRWRELERRVVLSQYLTAIQCAGRDPPQETGLTSNSWYGKFHLEMHWWHAAQFAFWGRLELLEKSLGYYARILPRARATARRQGYAGARWPKMTDPSGAESPSSIGPFLVWQQPHPIYYAELVYRQRPGRATLERFREVVGETAAFMASFAAWEPARRRYVLGPPLQCAQERFPEATTSNCSFELVYWRWGLEAAQRWRERLGLPREEGWDRVLASLAGPTPDPEGRYLFAESAPDSYTSPALRTDHPAVLGSLGMLPGPGVDPGAMRRTLDWIWDHWSWSETWGWDYPLVAMTAARLGQRQRAVDALLMNTPRNSFRANGHNHQRAGLPVYLPGNGSLLTAVALMAAGWDGGPGGDAPGFPDDGSWRVRHEGLARVP